MGWPQLTNTGLTIPSLEEIRAAYVDLFKDKFGNINTNPDSTDSRLIDILSETDYAMCLAIEAGAATFDPDASEDFIAENIAGLFDLSRLQKSQSSVQFEMTGTPGATVPENRLVKIQPGAMNEGKMFRVRDGFTFNGAGKAFVTGYCEEYGRIMAIAGTVTVIVNSFAGWTNAVNTADASPGRNVENSSQLTVRRLNSIYKPATATQPGIQAYLNDNVDGVTSAKVYVNTKNYVIDGIGPHCIEAVVEGGTDADVAEAIFRRKSASAGTSGNTSVNVTDDNGDIVQINFSRPTDVNVWFHIKLDVNSYFNRGTKSKHTVSVTSAVPFATYYFTVNGTTYQYVAGALDTASDIAQGLYNAYLAGTYTPVTVVYFSGQVFFTVEATYAGSPYYLLVANNMTSTQTAYSTGDQQDVIDNIVSFADGSLVVGTISGLQGVGDDVVLSKYGTPIQLVSNIESIEIYAGTAAALPTSGTNIAITKRQRAEIVDYRITVELI